MTFSRDALVSIRSGRLDLQGVINSPIDAPSTTPGVVVCHPHPQFGGDMDNAVVAKIAACLKLKGIVTLRFNFRGVGESNGTHDHGKGELDDLKSALRFLANWPGIDKKRIGVAGYSFGAMVALSGSHELKIAKALAFVSPPGSILDNQIKPKKGIPLLFVLGSDDTTMSAQVLNKRLGDVKRHTTVEIVNGATHFWRGREEDAAGIVAKFFEQELIEANATDS